VTYAELVAAIKGYAENDFPATAGSFTSTDQLNTFIKQAEQRIYNSIQFPPIQQKRYRDNNNPATSTSSSSWLIFCRCFQWQ
jgi:hypothetical protein